MEKGIDTKLNNITEKTKVVHTSVMVLGCFAVLMVICLFTFVFYHSLEREIYQERVAYLKEISEQVVSTTNSVSYAQWDLASIFADHLERKQISDVAELAGFISEEQTIFNQQGLSLLAFDKYGNYYDKNENEARWTGSLVNIQEDSPEHQVEITSLPTTIKTTDEMVFVLRMQSPVTLRSKKVTFTHVAVVRDMGIFNKNFNVLFF